MKPDDKLVTSAVAMAKENLRASEMLLPSFFIGYDEKVDVIAAPFNSEDEKDMVAKYIKFQVEKKNANFIMFICEAWVLEVDHKNYEKERAKYDSLSEHPLAVEIVNFVLETPNRCWGAQVPILPGRDLGEVKWQEFDEAKGRFANFFSAPKPTIQ